MVRHGITIFDRDVYSNVKYKLGILVLHRYLFVYLKKCVLSKSFLTCFCQKLP